MNLEHLKAENLWKLRAEQPGVEAQYKLLWTANKQSSSGSGLGMNQPGKWQQIVEAIVPDIYSHLKLWLCGRKKGFFMEKWKTNGAPKSSINKY